MNKSFIGQILKESWIILRSIFAGIYKIAMLVLKNKKEEEKQHAIEVEKQKEIDKEKLKAEMQKLKEEYQKIDDKKEENQKQVEEIKTIEEISNKLNNRF